MTSEFNAEQDRPLENAKRTAKSLLESTFPDVAVLECVRAYLAKRETFDFPVDEDMFYITFAAMDLPGPEARQHIYELSVRVGAASGTAQVIVKL